MPDSESLQERVRALEVSFKHFDEKLESHVNATEAKHDAINDKLDSLLSLRDKGMGAFWLASALVGAGLLAIVIPIIDWVRGLLHV